MSVLIACEESQAVTKEMRAIGVDAYSCDIEPCSGGHPEWHIQEDVTILLEQKWDMIIAFPPCTYLSNAGNRHYSHRINSEEKVLAREKKREQAVSFFNMFINAKCNLVAIENPVGYMNSFYRKPDQIIHPYYFGDAIQKKTCLWLKGLPPLIHTNVLPKPEPIYIRQSGKARGKQIGWCEALKTGPGKGTQYERAKARSKTFPGIAKAMAQQWGALIMGGQI